MRMKNTFLIVFAALCTVAGASCMKTHYCACDYVNGKDTVERFDPIYGEKNQAREDCLKKEQDTVHINLNCEFK